MIRAEAGSTVTISFIGPLENGRIFHSTEDRGPLTITIGSGQLFPALEPAIMGMGWAPGRRGTSSSPPRRHTARGCGRASS